MAANLISITMAQFERMRDEIASLRAINAELVAALEKTMKRFESAALASGSDEEFVDIANEQARAALTKAKEQV